jgi:hypothetical protein
MIIAARLATSLVDQDQVNTTHRAGLAHARRLAAKAGLNALLSVGLEPLAATFRHKP